MGRNMRVDQLLPRHLLYRLLGLLLICTAVHLAFAGPVMAGERGQGGLLRLYYWQAPTIVNPHLSPGTKDLSASRIVYEPLASFDAGASWSPSWQRKYPH